MTIGRMSRRFGAVLAAAALLAGCSSTTSGSQSSGSESSGSSAPAAGGTLVVDTFFDLKTVDPGREYEFTGNLLTKAMYDTLLTFKGGNVTDLVPDLANYEMSDDAKTLTLTLTPGRVFSDGSPVTTDDVVFSLQRVAGIKGNPSFLMAGVTVTKKDDKTVVLTSDKPNPALPFILPSPALSIVNSKVVKTNGGTTDDKDGAEKYLNGTSAGTGPYMLSSLDVSSQAKLVKNPKYNGDATPTYDTIVVRNVQSATQKLNVQKGDSQVALDLSGDQVEGLGSNLSVLSGPSAFTVFLLLNQSPDVSKATANADFDTAVKKAINFDDLLTVAGKGSVQAAGIIPSLFTGALPADKAMKFDLDGAKSALAASGMAGETVKFSYPSDVTLGGLSFQALAEKLQSQLKAAGINVDLAPAPVATELDPYRNGKEQIGLWYWGPDYPHAADYLAFGPGQTVGLRANWTAEGAPDIAKIVDEASTTNDPAKRADLYEQFQEQSNASGPFVPLVQPATNIVTAGTVSGAEYNPVWTIDLAELGKK